MHIFLYTLNHYQLCSHDKLYTRLVKSVAEHMRMEKEEEYGVPRLWKRVPVGTWVKVVVDE